MFRYLIALTLAACAAPAQTAELAGVWSGTLEVGSARLRLVLRVNKTDAGLSARLDSVDQGAMGIPATAVTQQGAVVRVEFRSLMAAFDGRLSKDGGELAGEWKQGSAVLPLTLKRGDVTTSRPQDPRKPYPYHDEDLVVENKAGGVKLAATLTLPNGKGPFAAVVLLTGSGAQDRNESIFGHRPFLVLADHLTRQGIAVLRADDRSVGGSTGSLATATYDDLAGDALACVEFLKSRKEVNARQIGLVGHSEGAAVAMVAANRSSDVAFLVLSGAPGVTGEQLMYQQSKMIARLPGGSERVAALNRKLQETMFAVVKQEPNAEAAGKKLKEAIQAFTASLTEEDRRVAPALLTAAEKQSPAMLTPAFRSLLTFDPAAALAKVKCPLLAIYGEKDTQVPTAQNVPPVAAALEAAGNRDYSIVKLPNLNHLLQTAKTGLVTEYAAIEETFAPAALNVISSWIHRHTR